MPRGLARLSRQRQARDGASGADGDPDPGGTDCPLGQFDQLSDVGLADLPGMPDVAGGLGCHYSASKRP